MDIIKCVIPYNDKGVKPLLQHSSLSTGAVFLRCPFEPILPIGRYKTDLEQPSSKLNAGEV